MSDVPDTDVPQFRLISPEQVLPLRQAVLRPMQTLEECVYPTDCLANTRHVGGFIDGQLISVGTFFPEAGADLDELTHTDPERHWRLRSMAVDPRYRGCGYGAALLDYAEPVLRAAGGVLQWCNARSSAVGFYLRCGWTIHGDEFDVPLIGRHFVMWRRL